jgi:Clp amino terminal domain, pathogenicity island component
VSSVVRCTAGQIVTYTGFKRGDALNLSGNASIRRGLHDVVRHHMRVPSRGLVKPPQMMFERFTEKAIKVVMLAQEEARRLGHNFVGTEQILLGLIGESTGIAAKVLKSMGVNLKDARIEVEKIIGRGSGFVAVEIPFTPRAKRVLELSLEEARQLGKGTCWFGVSTSSRALKRLQQLIIHVDANLNFICNSIGEYLGSANDFMTCCRAQLYRHGTYLARPPPGRRGRRCSCAGNSWS